MAIRGLKLYDIIADLLPGVTGFFIILPLIPAPIANSLTLEANRLGISGVLVFLSLSYVFGRFMHVIASRHWVKNELLSWLDCRVHKRGADVPNEGVDSIEQRLKQLDKENGSNVHTIEWVEGKTANAVLNNFRYLTPSGLQREEERKDLPSEIYEDDYAQIKYLGQSMLQGEDTLYQKYNILATFYRSLWLITFFGGFLYIFSLLGSVVCLLNRFGCIQLYGSTTVGLPAMGIFSVVLLTVSTLFGIRRMEFEYRRTRAFINDFSLHCSSGV